MTGVLFTGCSSETKNKSIAEKTVETTMQSEGSEKAEGELNHEFLGDDVDTPGYAEGTITFTCNEEVLYWSDDKAALEGYYEIAELELESAGDSQSFSFEYHIAIPVDAKKVKVIITDEYRGIQGNFLKIYSGNQE